MIFDRDHGVLVLALLVTFTPTVVLALCLADMALS